MARSGKQIGKRGDSPGRNHGEPARNRLNLRGRDRYAIGDVERGCRALEKGGAALARFTQRDRPIAEQGDEHPRKTGPCPYIELRSVAIGPVAQQRRSQDVALPDRLERRSEEHTSELQSLMRIPY